MQVQVAFQGGGAKFCDLLAAAEALQSMKDEINVVRVAGTSAGSIVACLFAAGIPVKEVRHRIASLGRQHLNGIIGGGSRLSAAWNLCLGKPIYSEPRLSLFLEEVFTYNGTKLRTFQQLNSCEVLITTADIKNGEAVVYRGDSPDRDFISCILDSCALPFIFRRGVTGSAMVDGGVCENLPVAMMADRNEPVLGFSFKRKSVAIETTRDYIAAIIDTMVSHSVTRSKSIAGADNIFPIDSEVGTLDFKTCLDVLDGGQHYDRTMGECKIWLGNRIRAPFVPPITAEQLMQQINDVHIAQHRPSDVTIQKATKRIIAHGLLSQSDPRRETEDEIIDTLTLIPSKDHVRSFRLGSSSKFGATTSLTDWRLTDKNMAEVAAIPIPVNLVGVNSTSNSVVFFFGRGLSPENAPYEFIRHSGQRESLNGLKEHELEYVITRSTQASVIERYEMVIYLPTEYAGTFLKDAMGGHESYPSSLPKASREGREMTRPELNGHPTVRGFVAKGWVYEQVAPGDVVAVVLIPVRPPGGG